MTETLSRDECVRTGEMVCVCCNCRRARYEGDDWRDHQPAAGERLTHGICPKCLYELYPDLAPLVRTHG